MPRKTRSLDTLTPARVLTGVTTALITMATVAYVATPLDAHPTETEQAQVAEQAGPPTETGYVILAKDGKLFLSSTPMGKAVAMPGGGMFISEAPPAADDKKTEAKPPAAAGAEQTWVTAGQSGAGTSSSGGRGGAMVMTMAKEGDGAKITTFVINDETKGIELLKAGDKVTVQFREINGDRIAEVVSVPKTEKGKDR